MSIFVHRHIHFDLLESLEANWIEVEGTHCLAMILDAWDAIAPCSIRRTLVDGWLLWENLSRYRTGPHSWPKTGLEAIPTLGFRPTSRASLLNCFKRVNFDDSSHFTVYLSFYEKDLCMKTSQNLKTFKAEMFVYIINLMRKTAEQNIYKNLTGMSISHVNT